MNAKIVIDTGRLCCMLALAVTRVCGLIERWVWWSSDDRRRVSAVI